MNYLVEETGNIHQEKKTSFPVIHEPDFGLILREGRRNYISQKGTEELKQLALSKEIYMLWD